MYINPFVAGILVTLGVEVVIFLGFIIYFTTKKNGGKK